MNRFTSGMIAGFVATIVLSLIMLIKASMGIMPQLNVIQMLAQMLHARMGLPPSPLVGWLMHFIIGTVLWGLLFSLLVDSLPGMKPIAKGMLFSTGAWLVMMVIAMPMAGAGFFGMNIGPMAPVMTLILHWIWGTVLGATFKKLARPS
ncbi:DUF6789 family protein [Chromohalobacter sp. HP20-39]|uniref:DUF6789 family protein n=1 Tax=Chromohalobacter sp. HP20-39 TaxID=3079306 RepID=UPI00294AAB45|nr:DUF6789 family protein [Chromohalobacter sp. HP20-39]MDV6317691.1 DUF6789 family protein [Chromohalobacter sp. HP20-39]